MVRQNVAGAGGDRRERRVESPQTGATALVPKSDRVGGADLHALAAGCAARRDERRALGRGAQRVLRPMPLFPASVTFHQAAVPIPCDATTPTPEPASSARRHSESVRTAAFVVAYAESVRCGRWCPRLDSEGGMTGSIGVVVEVTPRAQAQKPAQRARQSLAES